MAGGVGIEQPKSLQSICYKRGSLQLLDQVPLFLKTKRLCLLFLFKELVGFVVCILVAGLSTDIFTFLVILSF